MPDGQLHTARRATALLYDFLRGLDPGPGTWVMPANVCHLVPLALELAGKTPVALDLLVRLKKRGLSPHALTRGYGGSEGIPTETSLYKDAVFIYDALGFNPRVALHFHMLINLSFQLIASEWAK